MRAPLLFVVLAACTHHRDIREAGEIEGDVELEGALGQTTEAHAVPSQAGIAFQTRNGGWVPADEIVKITDKRHLRGAAEGMGIGALVGAATGAIVGYADGDDKCEGECFLQFSAGDKAVLGGFVVGVLGAGVGLLIGGMMGATFVYERKSTPPMVRPVGPPGSVGGVTIRF